MKTGQTVTFMHYGVEQQGVIARISDDGKIVHLTSGRWLHAESVKPVAPTIAGECA